VAVSFRRLFNEKEQAELLGEEPLSNSWPDPEPIETTLLPVEKLPPELAKCS